MDSTEKYRLMNVIWGTVIDYSTKEPISKVCDAVCKRLNEEGYDPKIEGTNRGFRIVRVQDQRYRVLRNAGWGKYDLIMID